MKWLSHIFQHNPPIKILSLLAAVGLWLFVMSDKNPTVSATFRRDLEITNKPEKTVVTADTETIRLKVRSQRSNFVSVVPANFNVQIDIGSLTEGTTNVPVQTTVPRGFEIISVQPETIAVKVENIIAKEMPINFITTGTLDPAVILAGIKSEQDKAKFTGPRSAVERVHSIIGYILLDRRDSDFKSSVSLVPIDQEGRAVENVNLSPKAVTTEVQVARGLTKKIVTVSPVVTGSLPPGYAIEAINITPAKIEIAGNKETLEKIKDVATQPLNLSAISEAALSAGRSSRKTSIQVTEGIIVADKNLEVEIVTKKK